MGQLMTEREAAESLKLSPTTLRTWRSRGYGPIFCRAGGAIRYLAEDIEHKSPVEHSLNQVLGSESLYTRLTTSKAKVEELWPPKRN